MNTIIRTNKEGFLKAYPIQTPKSIQTGMLNGFHVKQEVNIYKGNKVTMNIFTFQNKRDMVKDKASQIVVIEGTVTQMDIIG